MRGRSATLVAFVVALVAACGSTLITPDGQFDAVLDARAREVLGGLPVVVEFGGAEVPL